MDQNKMKFEDFLSDIRPDAADAVTAIHDLLVEQGCPVRMQQAKSGHVVSFTHPDSRKVVANFVSRKSGPMIRIYGDYTSEYPDFLDTLPEQLEKLVARSGPCRRMEDPAKCNSRCPMGYAISIRGTAYRKCRYNCFLFPVTAETYPVIRGFLEHEMQERRKDGR